MLKFYTVGTIEKSIKNFPNITAKVDIPNGSIVTANLGTKEAALPTEATAKGDDLYVVINSVVGDIHFSEAEVVEAGRYLNLFQLKALEGQQLIFDDSHVTYASGGYDDIAVDDVFVVGTDGKFTNADAEGYAVTFEVTDKISFDGNGFIVKVVIA